MKKQLAVLMAAATAVTTVAPVIANAADKTVLNDVSVSEVNKKIKEALATKFETKKEDGVNVGYRAKDVHAYANSRYIVFTDVPAGNGEEGIVPFGNVKAYFNNPTEEANFRAMFSDYTGYNVVNDADLAAGEIESYMLANPTAKVIIVDKGLKDKKSFVVTKNKIYVDAVVDADTEENLTDAIAKFESMTDLYKAGSKVVKEGTTKFTLKSGAVVEFAAGMTAYDFEKVYAADGQQLYLKDKNGADVPNKDSVIEQIVKFAVLENKDAKERELDVRNGDVVEYNLRKVYVSKIDVPTVYTSETGYTEAGADLVNKLIDAKNNKSNNTYGNRWFNYMGVSYNLVSLETSTAKIEKVGDKYVLKVDAKVSDNNDSKLVQRTIQFAFEGKIQKDLVRVLTDLSGNNNVAVGQFKKLAGMDRFDTAIQVSNERFEKEKSADSVVIVGANALMDGLSAVPLAAAKNAPVLLADAKNGLNDATVKEILRVTGSLNRKTVYVVGGMNSVPTSVDKMLSDKYGAVVVRIAGMDRYETSMKVLKGLQDANHVDSASNVYLVGGEGAADAMSISSVAAKSVNGKVSPVVVVPQKGISKETRNLIIDGQFAQKYAIGGENSISTNVLQTLADAGVAVKRIAGADRYATNVKVIKRFYTPASVKGLVVTSGDTKYLVDAQTSGALAAKVDAPVLLTGSSLSSDQLDLFKKDGVLYGLKGNSGENIFQVGGVVSADVMKTVVQKLGL